jgi:putative ABC transport system permease protein
VQTYELNIIAGRGFSLNAATDATGAFMINESAVHVLGWKTPEEAIGQYLELWQPGRIIGVVKDFHLASFRRSISPLVLGIQPEWYRYISIRIHPEDVPGTLAMLETQWRQTVPEFPLQYTFLDERFAQLYRSERQLRVLLRMFSILAIVIACLGLLGIASFTVTQRTKEVGIRKVLGASVSNIVLLLSREFILLVGLANLIAWPVAYYAMNRWLQDFAYRIELGPGVFIVGGVLALIIALMTVSAQAIKAARANPVDALRYE